MRHLFTMKVRIILVVAVLLTVALAVLGSTDKKPAEDGKQKEDVNVPKTVVQTLMTPFRYAGNLLTSQAENIYTYIFEYESLKTENEALRKQVSQMEELAREADSVARENLSLPDLYGRGRYDRLRPPDCQPQEPAAGRCCSAGYLHYLYRLLFCVWFHCTGSCLYRHYRRCGRSYGHLPHR